MNFVSLANVNRRSWSDENGRSNNSEYVDVLCCVVVTGDDDDLLKLNFLNADLLSFTFEKIVVLELENLKNDNFLGKFKSYRFQKIFLLERKIFLTSYCKVEFYILIKFTL